MSNEPTIYVVGNATADPELRFTPNGNAVVSFTVAQTSRRFDRNANKWVDTNTLFLRVNAWRDQAEHVSKSVKKGTRVVVIGDLLQRSFEVEGVKRTVIEMRARDVAVSLRYAEADVRKMARADQVAGEPGDYGNGAEVYEGPWGDEPPPEDV